MITKLKGIISSLLAFILVMSSVTFDVFAEPNSFSDVTSAKNYASAVDTLSKLEIIMGYPDGTFGPDKSITRTEVVAIALRIKGLEKASQNAKGITKYLDVANDYWGSGYINLATKEGIIIGDGDGRFRPTDNIKLEEAIRIISVVTGYEQEAISKGSWPIGYIELAKELNIMSKISHGQGEVVNRADVARIAYEFIFSRPVIASPKGGTYAETQVIELTPVLNGAKIYYTLDGTTPTTSSKVYSHPFNLSNSATVKAIVVKNNNNIGSVVEYGYIISQVTETSSEGSSGNRRQPTVTSPTSPNNSGVIITLNTDELSYNTNDDTYYLPDKIKSLSGILKNNALVDELTLTVIAGNLTVLQEKLFVREQWIWPNPKLIVGLNTIVIEAKKQGSIVARSTYNFLNMVPDNSQGLSLDEADNDSDGVPNWAELANGSDPNNRDTEGDGLGDYDEIIVLGTDPILLDTDGNGISDYDEDADNDTLSNGYELEIGTSPIAKDTDEDRLNDNIELVKGTDPLNPDTDNDNGLDGWEVENNFNPLAYNDTFLMSVNVSGTSGIDVSVNVNVSAQQAPSFKVEELINNIEINQSIPGWLGNGYQFEVDGSINNAELSFTFNESLLSTTDFQPCIYYFNEITGLLEEIPTIVNGNTATATVDHFSKYVLLNKMAFDKVWNTDFDFENVTSNSALSVVFAVDYSASMDTNDRDSLRLDVIKQFIDKLIVGKDKSAIIKYAAYATIVAQLTDNKETLYSAVDSIINDSGYGSAAGTNGSDAIKKALDLLSSSPGAVKSIIFLTDGEDNRSSYDYNDLISTALSENVSIYSIGLGHVNEALLRQIAEETGGKYYYAEKATLLEDIYFDISEDIDYAIDENNDLLPDEIAKAICDGDIRTGFNTNPFLGATYEQIQSSNDLDADGLRNGEEIQIKYTATGKPFLHFISDPTDPYTDNDIYTDGDEVNKYHSNPRNDSINYELADVYYLEDSENFVSDAYKDKMENWLSGSFEKVDVWVGNKIFGSNYDEVMMYKTMLVDYLKDAAELESEQRKMEEILDAALSWTNEINSTIGSAIDVTSIGLTASNIEEISVALETIHYVRAKLIAIKAGASPYSIEIVQSLLEQVRISYTKLSINVPQFVEFIGKAGPYLSVIGVLIDTGSSLLDAKENLDDYATIMSQASILSDYVVILDEISQSNKANKHLRAASIEVGDIVRTESIDLWNDFMEQALGVAGTVGRSALLAVVSYAGGNAMLALIGGTAATGGTGLVVLAVAAIAVTAVQITDFIFNNADVAESSVYLYGAAVSGEILADYFVSFGERRASQWMLVEKNVAKSLIAYGSTALMRQFQEKKLIEANKEYPWFSEWFVSWLIYNTDDAEYNIDRVEAIRDKYQTYLLD